MALLALVFGWMFVVSPQRAKAAGLNTQADQITSANASLVTQIALLKTQFASLPATEAKLAQYSQRIPGTPALAAFLRLLSATGAASHVSITAISPTSLTAVAGKSGRNLMASNVNISFTGHYAATEAFLTRIEGLQRAFLVTGLSISKAGAVTAGTTTGGAAADPDSLQVTITGRIFVAVSSNIPVTTPSANPVSGSSGQTS